MIGVGVCALLLGCDPAVDDERGDTDGSQTSAAADGSDGNGGDGDGLVPANAYCDPVASWPDGMTEFEEEVLILVNEARAAGASCGAQSFSSAAPLSMSGSLRCAARVHSKDMGERGFFDHTNLDGEDPFTRMERAGYRYSTAGENIAAGQTSPEQVMLGWMESPGHCSNIMNPSFTELGVGTFEAPGAQFPFLWTQTFGSP